MEKKQITKQIYSVEFDGTFDEIRKDLDRWQETYGSEYDSLKIEQESAYEGGYYHYLCGVRMETDQEFEARIAQEKKWKEDQDARDKAHYLQLKAKFEQ